jgi:hypothetical protein
MTNQEVLATVALVVNQMAKRPQETFIYISGKVTGLDPEVVKRKFKATEAQIKLKGYGVFNPTTYIKPDCDWQQAMKVCVAILPLCKTIVMQNDWKESEGAKKERELAETLGLHIIEADLMK